MIFEEYLPQCLAIGITRAEFGELNVTKLRPYLKAEEMKFDKKNSDFHLLGRYVFDAVSIAISNALRGKNDEPINYMDYPYDFHKMRSEYEEQERQRIANEKAMAQFQAFAEGVRKKQERV